MNGPARPPLLQVRNLKAWYETGSPFRAATRSRFVLDGVSLDIGEGEVLGLVGESGCGKTTLARALLGISHTWRGSVEMSGQAIQPGKGTLAVRLGVQAVFQDPYSSLNPSRRVGWLLEEPLRVQGKGDKASRMADVDAMLLKVGLDPGYRDRYPAELSGGQRQRIAIGIGLITRPRLLIADEPVSSLDVSVQAQILNLMKDLQEEYGFSCLFISHSLRVIRFMCDRVAIMHAGRIIETATAEKLFHAPEQEYTRTLLEGTMAR